MKYIMEHDGTRCTVPKNEKSYHIMPKLKQEQWLTMSYDVILLFFSAACTQQRPKVNVGVILHAWETGMLGTLWRFIPIPKTLAAKIVTRGKITGTSSPYLDEMMMTNVRQFQIQRFPNDKRFQTRLCAEVVNSVSKLWVTQKETNKPYPTTIFLRTL